MAAQDELTLLERVFLRIGSAETDEQLQNAVSKFLPPVLLKLSSQQEGVRKKVMELLVHINRRIKSRPKIQLPVDALLLQYQDPSAVSFVVNFTIIYIKLGYPRMSIEKQAELAPCLLNSLEDKPMSHQDSLLMLLMPIMGHIKMPPDVTKRRTLFGLSDKPNTSKMLLDFMIDVLLLPYNITSQDNDSGSQSAGRASSQSAPSIPPGMSEYSFKRVTGENSLILDDLEKAKIGILKFLGSGVFDDQTIVCHFIVATADTRHNVVTTADLELKKIIGAIDWNNTTLIAKLYNIFQGTVIIKDQKPTVKPENRRTPSSIRLRLKIFPYFLKSREAINQFPACLQIIFDSLYGINTHPKLKSLTVDFVNHVCINCSDAKLTPIGPVLLSGMVKLIAESKDDSKLRGQAYVAVGNIGRRLPYLVTKDMALLQTFFDALSQEDSNTRLAVQEALSLLSGTFKSLDESNMVLMEALIMSSIERPEPQVRLMAVQYASTVFPSHHIPSKYILLLACGDMKEEIYTEATKLLRNLPKTISTNEKNKLMPSFPELIAYIDEKASKRIKSQQKYIVGNNVLPFNPSTCAEILVYLRMCLAYSAGVIPSLDSPSEMLDQAPFIATYINNLLGEHHSKDPIQMYMTLIKQLLTAIGGSPAMYCLLEIVAVAPYKLAFQLLKHIDWIKNFLNSSKEDMRENAAQLFALVAAHALEESRFQTMIEELSNVKDKALEMQHGSILAMGYSIGRKLYIMQQKIKDGIEDMDVGIGSFNHSNNFVEVLKTIVAFLNSNQPVIVYAACIAVGEIGKNGKLPFPDGSDDNEINTKLYVVKQLLQKIQSNKETTKIKERAALAVGYLCVGDENFPHSKFVMQGLLDSCDPKQIEQHFSIGEALTYASLGPCSSAARDFWTVSESEFKTEVKKESEENLSWLLEEILNKYICHRMSHIRKAACVWSLAILKKCASHPTILLHLKSLQQAMLKLLGESDELTQDIVSKCLGVIYDCSTPDMKQELIKMLVDTLMVGRKFTVQVSEDTEIFEEGALGRTPTGSNLSTYKELCSIASDLNQPDLIYKFMHLANHNAVWNSKKGAAFGFSTIAAQAGEQLTPYLSKIVPRLYRYQYDPNIKIQQAMTSIWNSIVTDSKSMVEKYFKEILDDIITSLTSNLWRVRESSCLALCDLLRNPSADILIEHLEVIWENCFRVRDDIKESVRNAAELALKALSKWCIKNCDPNNGKIGKEVISVILPILLKKGMMNSVTEIKTQSLHTILKITKNAGVLLKPHISLLIITLLEALNTLEPQIMNYLSLHVSQNSEAQEKLDNARITAYKMSPMMETINLCVQYIDDAILAELVPQLIAHIRNGIGLKVGDAQFIISLTHQCHQELSPYAGKLLAALFHGLDDRNSSVRKSYASAIGHLVKTAKDNTVEKLFGKLKSRYFEKEDENVRAICGFTLQAITRHSPDVIKRHAAQILPLAFLAMHEDKIKDTVLDKENIWEEVWLESTPGMEGGIRLYFLELFEISQTALDSQFWSIKTYSADSINTIAIKLGSSIENTYVNRFLTNLIKGLSGRTWKGKEYVLKAIQSLCVNCKDSLQKIDNYAVIMKEVVEVLLKECRKENKIYKNEALQTLGNILESHQLDYFKEVYDIVLPIIDKNIEQDEEDKSNSREEKKINLTITVYQCLGQAWPSSFPTQETYQVMLCELLTSQLSSSVWKVQLANLKAIHCYVQRLFILHDRELRLANANILTTLLPTLIKPVIQCLGFVKYAAVKKESLDILDNILKTLAGCEQLSLLPSDLIGELTIILDSTSKDSKTELRDQADHLKKLVAGQ